jgi:FtsP/CotA-like multicopper oxidase with cupredoxin domain
MDRREFLAWMGSAACASAAARFVLPAQESARAAAKPDATVRISPVEIEIAPGKKIKTVAYNDAVPGPILRFREGQRVNIEVQNESTNPELIHWHGCYVPSDVDGAAEEGTPLIPPHGTARYSFVARPSGTRWYHSHGAAGQNLKRSTYTGQFGFLYIEPKGEPGAFDAEVFLAVHGWDGYMTTGGDEDGTLEVAYKNFTINSYALGYGEPIRVKEGQRVLFRILNANATTEHRIAFTGHKFKVIALDGNPVPHPQEVDVIDLGPAERADAIVTMDQPGVWILGEADDQMRKNGLGIVIEYANQSGEPKWGKASSAPWDYLIFGAGDAAPSGQEPELLPLVFKKKFAGSRWVDYWTVNGKSFPKTDPIFVQANKRYRLRLDNQSDEAHPVHLHRHSFELKKFAGKATSGIFKDVVVVPPMSQVDADLVADNPGDTLFHCHQQLHMDFGFMTLIQYKG